MFRAGMIAAVCVAFLGVAACGQRSDAKLEEAANPAVDEGGHGDGPLLPKLECFGEAFPQNVTKAYLQERYGADQLVEQDVKVADSVEKALVANAKDPALTIRFMGFAEGSKIVKSASISGADSQWLGPKGLFVGMSLEALRELNGAPFRVYGFQNHNSGETNEWGSGVLAENIAKGCYVSVTLAPAANAKPEDVSKVSKEATFSSDDPALRAVNPEVAEISIIYP